MLGNPTGTVLVNNIISPNEYTGHLHYDFDNCWYMCQYVQAASAINLVTNNRLYDTSIRLCQTLRYLAIIGSSVHSLSFIINIPLL